MIRSLLATATVLLTLLWMVPAFAESPAGIDPRALIDQILLVDSTQRASLHDLVFQTERLDGEYGDKGEFKEKARWIKKTYIKYLPDTALFKEEPIEYYKEGKLQTADERDKEFATLEEKKKRRKGFDLSYHMIRPFLPKYRGLYEIKYLGVDPDKKADYVCHHFSVRANEEVDTLINGDYYFEADNFHLVRVEFEPAKLVKATMFKMNDLHMALEYAPGADGLWLPKEFTIRGKAKAMFFIGIQIAGREYYRSPVVNGGIKDELFEVSHDE
jgi:hypothetical protein